MKGEWKHWTVKYFNEEGKKCIDIWLSSKETIIDFFKYNYPEYRNIKISPGIKNNSPK